MRRFDARAGLAAAVLIAASALPHAAHAGFQIVTNLDSLPNNAAFTPIELTAAQAGSTSFTLDGASVGFSVAAGQGVVTGSLGGEYADPIAGPGTPYQGYYFSTGTGEITFTYSTNQSAVALLWGSVDTYNSLEFLENGVAVGTIAGSQITQNANGSQGYGGSYYTEIISNTPFNEIIAIASSPSFEFAEFESAPTSSNIPEPASLAAMGAGLLALAGLHRRRA